MKNKRSNFNTVLTAESLNSPAGSHYSLFFQQIIDAGAKIRLLIVGEQMPEEIKQALEDFAPKNGCFKVKAVEKSAFKDYVVVDDKEVWIGTQQKTQAGYPNILWTNDSSIVEAYSENFDETWNSPKSVLIEDNEEQPEQQSEDVELHQLPA